MPIYEYVCRDCGEQVERLQRLSDAPLTECPACEQPALKRKVSAAGFRLSGGGWYETDFKSDGKRNIAGDTDAKSSATSSDKSESVGKSDGKSGTDKSGDASNKPAENAAGAKASKTESKPKSSGASTDS